MSRGSNVAWRLSVAVGWLAVSSALSPLIATAQQVGQQPLPSGAAVEVGGVQARPAAVQGAQTGPVAVEGVQTGPVAVGGGQTAPVTVEGVQARPVQAGGAQSRPIVLPNTGGGRPSDDQPWLLFLPGLAALAAGTYLRWRASRARAGG